MMRPATAVFILSGPAGGQGSWAGRRARTPSPPPRGRGGFGGTWLYWARKKIEAVLGLNDELFLMGPGRIYSKGLKRIRVEMAELGGKIGVKVRDYIKIGVVI